jgi:hypothetical protein
MKELLILYLILLSYLGYAQPGGGGGMIIENIYLKSGEKIALNDLDLKLRAYQLTGDSFNSTIETEYKIDVENKIYLNYHSFRSHNVNSHRLFIQYKRKKMVIDFHYIIPENPAGIIEKMDSLVIQKGHFRFYKNFQINNRITDNVNGAYKNDSLVNNAEILKRIGNGFTPSTINFFNDYLLVDNYLGDNRVLKRKKSDDYVLNSIASHSKYAVIEKRKIRNPVPNN